MADERRRRRHSHDRRPAAAGPPDRPRRRGGARSRLRGGRPASERRRPLGRPRGERRRRLHGRIRPGRRECLRASRANAPALRPRPDRGPRGARRRGFVASCGGRRYGGVGVVMWAIPMLLSGGLFTGGVLSLAWERIPAWREAVLADFQSTFARTLRRGDRLQPALLVVCLLSTIGFAVSEDGAARAFPGLAAAGFLTILLGSGAWLVPIQRRLVEPDSKASAAELEKLRAQWLRGHGIRTIVALASLTLAVVAAVS